MSQDEINACLVEHGPTGRARRAAQGRRPVRVRPRRRGGRGAARAGIAYEVVPGITSRDRRARLRRHPGHASRPRHALHGRHRPRGSDQGPRRRSTGSRSRRAGGTLVILMGVGGLRRDRRAPADRRWPARPTRRPPSINRGTTAGRRRSSAARSRRSPPTRPRVRPPAITVVGPVAALRDVIAWAERRPLHGVTVAVTRARAQASDLVRRLRELGAERRRGARDPDRADRRAADRRPGLRPRLPDEPERAGAAARAHRRRRAAPRRRRCGRDRARHGGGDPRDRDPARRGRRAGGRRGPARGAGRRGSPAGACWWPGPRRRATRSRTACTTRAPRASTWCRCTARCAEVPRRADALAADLVTFTSSSTVRFFATRVRRPRPRAPCGASRSAPSRRRRCASSASRSSTEAARHDLDGLSRP